VVCDLNVGKSNDDLLFGELLLMGLQRHSPSGIPQTPHGPRSFSRRRDPPRQRRHERLVQQRTHGDSIHRRVHSGGRDSRRGRPLEHDLKRPSPPIETGDLAYRATVSRQELEGFHDPGIDELLNKAEVTAWLGPEKHCVFYPVRNKTEYNLVLLSVPTHT
jgi:hypothetical protein